MSLQMVSSALPLDKIYDFLMSSGINTKLSDDAGSYGCIYIFYKVCILTESNNIHGFIHIPNLELYKKQIGRELDLLDMGKKIVNCFL